MCQFPLPVLAICFSSEIYGLYILYVISFRFLLKYSLINCLFFLSFIYTLNFKNDNSRKQTKLLFSACIYSSSFIPWAVPILGGWTAPVTERQWLTELYKSRDGYVEAESEAPFCSSLLFRHQAAALTWIFVSC